MACYLLHDRPSDSFRISQFLASHRHRHRRLLLNLRCGVAVTPDSRVLFMRTTTEGTVVSR